jgi:4-amino-4-deoxy-L-arabinose transferase-like glycosyltransferase
MGNAYYAAAVKSGAVSWRAFFFGSFDPGSFSTVDKLPASFWVPALSARLFGFSSWSILLPQALAGVASVLILYKLVRRWQGDVAGLLAALVLALTPTAVLIFRFNNPDALLTLLLLLAAWAFWSALEEGSTWSLVACGVLIGLAFLTKMLEALVIVPAFVLVYLVCGPRRLGQRFLQILAAAGALVVTSGWWVAIVELWPAASRPYIGGTTHNTVLDLIFSRNGGYLGDTGLVPNFSGSPGWLRMFNSQWGGQIAWLVPLALAGLVAGLVLAGRAGRTDRTRAGYVLWGAWALLYLGALSMAKGILHPYYAVVIAPALAALAGAGSVAMWRLGRRHRWLAWMLPAAVAGTAVLAVSLLGRTPRYAPGLAVAVEVVGAAAAVGLALGLARVVPGRAVATGAAALGIACVLAGPAAYSLSTVARSISGPLATAGPAAGMPFGGGSLGARPGGPGTPPGLGGPGAASPQESTVDRSLVDYLLANQGGAEFLVAVGGAVAAEPIIIATGEPVMAIGGFLGFDLAPTLTEFQQMVAARKVRFLLVGGFVGGPGGSFAGPAVVGGTFAAIRQWATQSAGAIGPADYGGARGAGTLYKLW